MDLKGDGSNCSGSENCEDNNKPRHWHRAYEEGFSEVCGGVSREIIAQALLKLIPQLAGWCLERKPPGLGQPKAKDCSGGQLSMCLHPGCAEQKEMQLEPWGPW